MSEVEQRLPIIIGVVIAAAFLLLLASFRSPVLALKAAVLNFFSIGAAYGVIVAVFQWGWGSSLLGVSEKAPIESYVPMIMFAIIFGLSMDYEVFLLTRVREAWGRTHDNHASVAAGLAATARVITCAALIITCVFLAFLFSGNVVVKMLALGLGVSIIVDATIIRLLVVPATMFLLGKANWWTPRWLGRIPALLEPLDGTPGPHAAAPDMPAGPAGDRGNPSPMGPVLAVRLPGARHLRKALGGYELWRQLHRLTGLFVAAGFAHALLDGTPFSPSPLLRWTFVAVGGTGLAFYAYRELLARHFVPLLDYQVDTVRPVGNGILEIGLKPLGRPVNFAPGQFAMLFLEGRGRLAPAPLHDHELAGRRRPALRDQGPWRRHRPPPACRPAGDARRDRRAVRPVLPRQGHTQATVDRRRHRGHTVPQLAAWSRPAPASRRQRRAAGATSRLR